MSHSFSFYSFKFFCILGCLEFVVVVLVVGLSDCCCSMMWLCFVELSCCVDVRVV